MINNFFRQFFAPTLSLFTSFSTLICCALPAFMIMLGMGASLAGLISLFPWITNISKYKIEIFIAAGILLLFSAILFWRDRHIKCPTDPKLAKLCLRLRSLNFILILTSITFYFVGIFFAFFATDFFI